MMDGATTGDGIAGYGHGGALLTVVMVNYNTADFIKVSLYSLYELTKNPFKIIICDNGSRLRDKLKLKKFAREYENTTIFFRKQTKSGSMGHGEALNILVGMIDTKYGVILDADAVFLKKNWDQHLIDRLDDQVKIVGTPPVKNILKNDSFPLMYAVLFDAIVFKRLNIDMRPRDPRKGQDTGWEMKDKYEKNGFAGSTLIARNTREYKKGPFKDVICAEYYYEEKGDVFVSHFGRGSAAGAGKYKMKIPMFKLMAGMLEKGKWLNICKTIVKGQAENQ